MQREHSELGRRQFISRSLLAGFAAVSAGPLANAADALMKDYRICVFEKYLQDLSYDELADVVAELGFVGIEATVRNKGHVLPERVEDDLPKLVEALKKRNLEVTTMASDVLNPSEPLSEKVLRTAKSLGINSYRMGFYQYDLNKRILPQLDEIRPQVQELAAFNRDLGMTAFYQNHSDAKYVGATLWDMFGLLQDIPKDQVGLAFDIRHATVEAGLSWPVLYDVVKPHIGALFVKDFQWDGRKAKHVPLGTGRVDPKFFEMVKADGFNGPISLHVEYLDKEGTQANIEALRRDLQVLRNWLS
ncbi:sugar phosphate isomerase/epimerase family protein [Novipirellula caenicola]|uniref:sugar phosphate isomerase/epimerase family protein n=1 Tax=Novipirellula caenicola TaxID=1536901 RepID=UPI0031F1A8AF